MVVLASSAPATPQDSTAEPIYGTVSLDRGSTPDGLHIDVRSGGSISARDNQAHCQGYIANAPDLRLQYNASSRDSRLVISVSSSADTTLVIRAPDGSWTCDDNSGAGVNPRAEFTEPQFGDYAIWVGSHGASDASEAQVLITENSAVAPMPLPPPPPAPSATTSGSARGATVISSSGPSAQTYPVGSGIGDTQRITLRSGDRLTLLQNGRTRVVQGPGTFILAQASASGNASSAALARRRPGARARAGVSRGDGGEITLNNGSGGVDDPVTESPLQTARHASPLATPQNADASGNATVPAITDVQPPYLNLPPYQPWPPEEASSRISLDLLLGSRTSLSLYDTGHLLREALTQAGYGEHSFYSVPGGFILVTETERTDTSGKGITGPQRYMRPGEERKSLYYRIRDLFLERPESYYRYIAIVVSDQPFGAVGEELTPEEAGARLRRGMNDLTDEAQLIEFGERYRVTALIYEFVNDGIGYDLAMIAPGRLAPQEHLEASGLAETLPQVFARREAVSN